MDGVHDLGGREGFGPVRWEADEGGEPFHEDWEARAWALIVWGWRSGHQGWTIDRFRHVRELIEPIDYLTRPYFDHWVQTLAAMMIDENLVEMDELKKGRSSFKPEFKSKTQASASGPVAPDSWDDAYACDAEGEAIFTTGDQVRTKPSVASRHTRLPGYARGRIGVIEAHHGGQIFADDSARGVIRGEHLYTVAFDASELWPETAHRRDRVFIDLWESYLERA